MSSRQCIRSVDGPVSPPHGLLDVGKRHVGNQVEGMGQGDLGAKVSRNHALHLLPLRRRQINDAFSMVSGEALYDRFKQTILEQRTR